MPTGRRRTFMFLTASVQKACATYGMKSVSIFVFKD